MTPESIIYRLNQINPNTKSLYDVDAIIEDMHNLTGANSEYALEPMFLIFERVKPGHYDSVLWSILHAIEGINNYEDKLIESVKRKPCEFNTLMVNRILNGGQKTHKDFNLVTLLQESLKFEGISEGVRESVMEYLEMHK